jgi:hypothetical protein
MYAAAMASQPGGDDQAAVHRVLLDNVPWLGTLFLFALVLIMVLIVARFGTATTLALVQHSGILTIAFGESALAITLILYLVFYALFMAAGKSPRGSTDRLVLIPLFVAVGLLLMWIGPWTNIIVVLFLSDLLLGGLAARQIMRFVDWQGKREDERGRPSALDTTLTRLGEFGKGPSGSSERIAVTFGIPMLMLAGFGAILPFLSSTPWVPEERIGLSDGSVLVGYVMASDGTQMVVLRADDRAVEYLSPDVVMTRTICVGHSASTNLASPAQWFAGPAPHYPLCTAPKPLNSPAVTPT